MVLVAVLEKNVVENKDSLISYGKRDHQNVKRMDRFCNKEIQRTYFSYIGKTYNSDTQNSARVPAEKST